MRGASNYPPKQYWISCTCSSRNNTGQKDKRTVKSSFRISLQKVFKFQKQTRLSRKSLQGYNLIDENLLD